jgi:hypothetical protein
MEELTESQKAGWARRRKYAAKMKEQEQAEWEKKDNEKAMAAAEAELAAGEKPAEKEEETAQSKLLKKVYKSDGYNK